MAWSDAARQAARLARARKYNATTEQLEKHNAKARKFSENASLRRRGSMAVRISKFVSTLPKGMSHMAIGAAVAKKFR